MLFFYHKGHKEHKGLKQGKKSVIIREISG